MTNLYFDSISHTSVIISNSRLRLVTTLLSAMVFGQLRLQPHWPRWPNMNSRS